MRDLNEKYCELLMRMEQILTELDQLGLGHGWSPDGGLVLSNQIFPSGGHYRQPKYARRASASLFNRINESRA